jgi:hypothetical protein
MPLAKFLVGTLLAEWNALSNGWSWAYNHLIKPVFDALVWAYNNILKPIADFFAGIGAAATSAAKTVLTAVSTIGGTTTVVPVSGGAIPHGAEGGIITRPTVMLAGEAGPEALIPLNKSGFGATIQINSPLVYVAGSADQRTVDLAVKKVEKILDNIILEASSSGGPSTHKRVRIGTGRF